MAVPPEVFRAPRRWLGARLIEGHALALRERQASTRLRLPQLAVEGQDWWVDFRKMQAECARNGGELFVCHLVNEADPLHGHVRPLGRDEVEGREALERLLVRLDQAVKR